MLRPLLITSHRTQNGLIVNGIRTAIPSPTSACMPERGAPLASDIFYGPLWKLGDQSSLASKAVSSVSERKCAFLVYCNSSPLRGRLGHDVYDILLGVLPHYRDPTPLLVLGKMPRNFKAKREETRSMVGPVDEAIAILLDSKPNGDQRPISPPYAWEVDENPFPIGYPLPSLKIVRGFGFCQCLSISCCGLGCQEVSPRGASRRGSSMNASFIQTSCTIPFPPTLAI